MRCPFLWDNTNATTIIIAKRVRSRPASPIVCAPTPLWQDYLPISGRSVGPPEEGPGRISMAPEEPRSGVPVVPRSRAPEVLWIVTSTISPGFNSESIWLGAGSFISWH